MPFGLFAHQQTVQRPALLVRNDRGGGNQRVRAQGHAPDAAKVNVLEQVVKQTADKPGAFGVQCSDAAVKIVIASAAGGQQKITFPVGFFHQQPRQTALEVQRRRVH